MVSIRMAAVNLGAYSDRARTVGGMGAANAMAECGRAADREQLIKRSHPAHTRTPSPPGQSPAWITGTLYAAQDITPAAPSGPSQWTSHAGPNHTASSFRGPYGRFLEFGGTHTAHTSRGMRWLEDGVWHTAYEIAKAPRPYLLIALVHIVADGTLHAAAVRGFEEAMGL